MQLLYNSISYLVEILASINITNIYASLVDYIINNNVCQNRCLEDIRSTDCTTQALIGNCGSEKRQKTNKSAILEDN